MLLDGTAMGDGVASRWYTRRRMLARSRSVCAGHRTMERILKGKASGSL